MIYMHLCTPIFNINIFNVSFFHDIALTVNSSILVLISTRHINLIKNNLIQVHISLERN